MSGMTPIKSKKKIRSYDPEGTGIWVEAIEFEDGVIVVSDEGNDSETYQNSSGRR